MSDDLKMVRPNVIENRTDPSPDEVANPPAESLASRLNVTFAAQCINESYGFFGKSFTLSSFAEAVVRAMFANGMSKGDIRKALLSALDRSAQSIIEFNENKDGIRDTVFAVVEDKLDALSLAPSPSKFTN